MAIYKRGRVWWYKFTWNGEPIRESTKQGNKRIAEQIESVRKGQLAKGEVGIRDRAPVPSLEEFAKRDFLPYVESRFVDKPSTRSYYSVQTSHLVEYKPLATSTLDTISRETIAGFVEKQRQAKYEISSINRALQVLRRMLHLAVEWGQVEKAPVKVRLIPGEKRRERVLSEDEETAYLSASGAIGDSIVAEFTRALDGIRATKRGQQPMKPRDPYLLRDVATMLLDCGLRPEECYRMRWEHVRKDTVYIPHGKTASARREIPITERLAAVFKVRRECFNE